MGLVRDDEIEIGRREKLLVLVVEQQGLDSSDDDLSVSPVSVLPVPVAISNKKRSCPSLTALFLLAAC